MRIQLRRVVSVGSRKSPFDDDLRPYVGLEHITSWTGEITDSNDARPESLVAHFEKGDVLFSKLRPYLAKVAAPGFRGVCSTEALVIKPGNRVRTRFLRYSLSAPDFINRVDAATYGVKMPRANWESIGKEAIWVPDLDTQGRIADFLDRKTATIDELIKKKRRLVEVLGEKRSALITAAVTGRLDPVSGQIRDSAEGRGVRLKYVCSLYGDYGLNVSADDYIQDGIPIIRTSDFDDLGRLDLSNPKMISEDIAPSKMLRRGDVLFSRAGTVGRCTVYNNPRPSTFASYLVRFRPKTSIADPRFIGWWAQSHQYWSQVRAGTIETTIGNFNAVRFGNLILPNVALTVQRAIADFLDRKTATIDELIEKTDASIDLWKEYRAALITAAVTGQIDVTTWKGHTAHRPGAIGEAPK